MVHLPLNDLCVDKILPIYPRLAEDATSARCAQGKTQNANESLYNVIWYRCPKENFASKKKIYLGSS
jgi:hypothetical protein